METYIVKGKELSKEELREIAKRDIFNLEPLQARLIQDFKAFKRGLLKPNETLVALNRTVGFRCKDDSYTTAELLLFKLKRHVTFNRLKDNLGKEISLQPSYEEYCRYIFDLLVFKRRKYCDLPVQRMIKEFVVIDLKSNLVSPVKNKELLELGYKTLNDRDISKLEYKLLSLLVWRLDDTAEGLQEEYGKVDMDNLLKVKDIYFSYLNLLNLRQYRDSWDLLYERMDADLDFALNFYYPMLFILHTLSGEFKDKLSRVMRKLKERRKEEINRLNEELIHDLTCGEVIKHREGKNILLVSKYGIDKIEIGDYTITFMEPSYYSSLRMNNVYDFRKFDYIKDYKDLTVNIFRG